MKPEEIYTQFLKKNQNVLVVGRFNDILEEFLEPRILKKLDQKNDYSQELKDLDTDFDYVILTEVLELVDDPRIIINQFKNLANTTVIYEFKYDDDCKVEQDWKKPWKSTGLEWILQQEFDKTNSIYLGYATIHFCDIPYNRELENDNQ